MICDRFHLLQKFLCFSAKANSSYDPNDGKRGCCHQVCHKLYYPKEHFSVGKSLVLFKCQQHFNKEYICFEMKLYKLTSSSCITLIFLVNSRKGMFHNGNENSDI